MNKISQVDKNFSVETSIQKEDIKFYNIDDEPFKIYGVFKEGGKYRRMPESVAKTVSDGVYYLHSNTSGGRVRFKTDSKYVYIRLRPEDPKAKWTEQDIAGYGFTLSTASNKKSISYPNVTTLIFDEFLISTYILWDVLT